MSSVERIFCYLHCFEKESREIVRKQIEAIRQGLKALQARLHSKSIHPTPEPKTAAPE
jgi:phage-related protein